jgi:hypothetical protein
VRLCLSHEEEAQFRQSLLEKASKGDEKAQQELQETYGVRLWSEQERAKLLYENPKAGKQKTRKS